MKNLSKKEINYSLHNIENYNKDLDCEISKIAEKISELLIDYVKFIVENIKLKETKFSRFIIMRGLDTIINIFNYILFYTKNLDVAYFHCQKAFYFYVEFVGQISEDEKMFLQLSSRDATMYVYKKTIYEISNEFKKNSDQVSEKTKVKLDIVNSYMEINKTIILKLINNEFTNVEKQNTTENILNNINNSNNSNNINHNSNIKKLNNIIETLYFKTINDTYFFEVCEMLFKKISKNEEYLTKCCNKLLCDDFNDKIKETSGIFITWFMN
jgi:hypothetical protein